MQPQRQTIPLEVAVVSDKGLNPKRPLNEDSYYADANRRLFVVADGVGGAQAGEVASETAVEVLKEAFQHQLNINEDVEDLMEIAVQRANNSIYQMAREHPKFSAMATTVVILHLDGLKATIGHVGDSRLYRLSPDGRLYRETQDHSVVEEEVRAGRMTPEQAAHHPSRNVISRALGADANVEVDMRTISYEDGTAFLLCSDGITRHISDAEIRELLGSRYSLEKVCAEFKRRCYERGAEDNLTAIAVRVGGLFSYPEDDERTIATPRPAERAADDYQAPQIRPSVGAEPRVRAATAELSGPVAAVIAPEPSGSGTGFLGKLFIFLLLVGGVVGGVLAGMKWREKILAKSGPIPFIDAGQPTATPTATPNATLPTGTVVSGNRAEFLKKRNALDDSATEWLRNNFAPDSDPNKETAESLYLRGRAQILTANASEAVTTFGMAEKKLPPNTPSDDSLRLEIRAGLLRAQAMVNGTSAGLTPVAAQEARQLLNDILGLREVNGEVQPVNLSGRTPATNATPSPAATPTPPGAKGTRRV